MGREGITQAARAQDDDEKAIGVSPDDRFPKFEVGIGRESFKNVYRGLDTQTGVAGASCELQEPLSSQSTPHGAVAAGTIFPVGQPLAGIEGVPVLPPEHPAIVTIIPVIQMIPLRIAPLLPVPTPFQPTNSSVFPIPGVQPSLVPMAGISVNTMLSEANDGDNQAGKTNTSGLKKKDEQPAKREEVVASRKISRSQLSGVKEDPVACVQTSAELEREVGPQSSAPKRIKTVEHEADQGSTSGGNVAYPVYTDEEFRVLLRRQKLEQDILQKKHQQEIEIFQHNQHQLKRSSKFDLEPPQPIPTGEEMVHNTGQQYIANPLPIMSPSQGVVGYAGASVYPQTASHVTSASFMTGLRAGSSQIPRIGHCTEPVWVHSAHPIPSSSQSFHRYPVGTIQALPAFQRFSTACGCRYCNSEINV